MKIVIQCAGGKNAEGYWRTKDGKDIKFVANPEANPDYVYACPDGVSDHPPASWRELLCDYNKDQTRYLFKLHRAYELYKPKPPYEDIYRDLVTKFGVDNVYILSAGGLIRSDFLTPQYNITFSNSNKVKAYQRHWEKDRDKFKDFGMLPKDTTDTIVCLGSKDYIPLFCCLATHIQSKKKVVFYNSSRPPNARGCFLKHYDTNGHRTWVYECAKKIIDVFCSYSENAIKHLTAREVEKLLEAIKPSRTGAGLRPAHNP